MKQRNNHLSTTTLLLCWSLLLLLSGCGSSRKAIQQVAGHYTHLTKSQFIELYSQKQEYPSIAARGRVSLKIDLPEKQIQLNGIGIRWYQAPGKGFELSIRPIGFMEAGRLTVADDTVLALDRLNKYYLLQEEAHRKLSSYLPIPGIDPMILQAVIENKPFNFVEIGATALRRMEMKRTEEGYLFSSQLRPGGNQIKLLFDTALNLSSATITVPGEGELQATYDRFTHLRMGGEMLPLPAIIQIEFRGGPERYGLIRFDLQDMEESKARTWETTPPAQYQRISLQDIYKIIQSL